MICPGCKQSMKQVSVHSFHGNKKYFCENCKITRMQKEKRRKEKSKVKFSKKF